MTVSMKVPPSLTNFLDVVKPEGRRNLFSVAANALRILIQSHIRANAPRRHQTAQRLGANASRLMEKGAARVTSASSEDHAEVTIPIVGMGRAFHDVTITPVAAKALTIPTHATAYNRRVGELVRMGWIVFRPKGSDVLMGYQGKSKDAEPVSLYTLKKRVTQKQDRSLLPSDAEINQTVAQAMMMEITRLSRKSA